MRVNFRGCVRYFHGESVSSVIEDGTKTVTLVEGKGRDSPSRFIAFIAIWLARHVLVLDFAIK